MFILRKAEISAYLVFTTAMARRFSILYVFTGLNAAAAGSARTSINSFFYKDLETVPGKSSASAHAAPIDITVDTW
jgi:hypothetical protein